MKTAVIKTALVIGTVEKDGEAEAYWENDLLTVKVIALHDDITVLNEIDRDFNCEQYIAHHPWKAICGKSRTLVTDETRLPVPKKTKTNHRSAFILFLEDQKTAIVAENKVDGIFQVGQQIKAKWNKRWYPAEIIAIGLDVQELKSIQSGWNGTIQELEKVPSQPVPSISTPVAESAEPVTESAGPVTESAGPVTESAGPVTESAGPVAESAGPVTESAASVLLASDGVQARSVTDDSVSEILDFDGLIGDETIQNLGILEQANFTFSDNSAIEKLEKFIQDGFSKIHSRLDKIQEDVKSLIDIVAIRHGQAQWQAAPNPASPSAVVVTRPSTPSSRRALLPTGPVSPPAPTPTQENRPPLQEKVLNSQEMSSDLPENPVAPPAGHRSIGELSHDPVFILCDRYESVRRKSKSNPVLFAKGLMSEVFTQREMAFGSESGTGSIVLKDDSVVHLQRLERRKIAAIKRAVEVEFPGNSISVSSAIAEKIRKTRFSYRKVYDI